MLCVIFVIPLHCQNETRILIKNNTNMKTLELKDLKVGKIYKRVEDDDTLIYVQVLSEGSLAICNYVYILLDFDRSNVCISEIRKNCYLTVAQGYKSTFIPCTQEEFNQALQRIKDSLTF